MSFVLSSWRVRRHVSFVCRFTFFVFCIITRPASPRRVNAYYDQLRSVPLASESVDRKGRSVKWFESAGFSVLFLSGR